MEFLQEVEMYKFLTAQQMLKKAEDMLKIYIGEKGKRMPQIEEEIINEVNEKVDKKDVDYKTFNKLAQKVEEQVLLVRWKEFESLTEYQVKLLCQIARFNYYSLNDIFYDDHLFYVFKNFLKDEYADEILQFYEDLERFKKKKNEKERFQMAQTLYTTYINGSSHLELNITSESKEKMSITMKNIVREDHTPTDIFDEVFTEIKSNTLIGIWSRFKGTDHYDRLFE